MGTILIVDDDPVLLALNARLLRRAGHYVVEAASGAACLAEAAHHRFDVIISDVIMPDMDGFSLVHELRRRPGLADTRLVLLTSHLAGPDADAARAAGADAWAVKSASASRLRNLVDGLLAQSETERP
jgi:CheY-like chemotaxis protein